MKKIKNYKDFSIMETYTNNPVNRLQTLFDEMIKNMKFWFTEGSLSKQGLSLYELERSTANDYTEKNILVDFSDNQWYYQVIIIVKLEDVKGNEPITDAYLKIKKYDMEQTNLIRTWEGEFDLKKDFNENFIIDKISELDDKTHDDQDDLEQMPDEDVDLKDNIY